MLQKLRRIRPDGRVGVFASGSPVSPERYGLGVASLTTAGYSVLAPVDPTVCYGSKEHGFACESPIARRDAIHTLLDDSSTELLLAARGAYGTLDVLPLLDFARFARARKPVVGCSDVTALLAQVVARAGIPAIHGPTLASAFADAGVNEDAAESVSMLLEMLRDPAYRLLQQGAVLRAGRAAEGAKGQLIGGNLTMMLTLLGTPWDIDYRGAILVLEDVGEAPFRVHRAFTQLRLAGKLSQLAGLVIGRFARCEAAHGPTIDEVFEMVARDLLADTDYPVIRGLEFGHWGQNVPLPLGCTAEIRGENLVLLESPVE